MSLSIPFEDYGGHGPLLHFAHANAYPPATYNQLLTRLSDHFSVLAMHFRPVWPGSQPEEMNAWSDFATDMITFLDKRISVEVIGLGHSLGAVTTMMAAHKRPDLFRALILVEPIFLPPTILRYFRQQPGSVQSYQLPPVEIAKRRRNGWADRQEAFDYFRPKPVFARWPDRALWDYVKYGLERENSGELKLVFSPDWEAHIYSRPPTEVWELIPQITHPLMVIRGLGSDALLVEAWQLLKKTQAKGLYVEIPDSGHLVPMERPQEVVKEIIRFVQKIEETRR